MNDLDPRDPARPTTYLAGMRQGGDRDRDHWDVYAEAMDLTIEGHRLIADAIVFEAKLLWRAGVSRLRNLLRLPAGRRPV